ncbi:phytoene/squalene synthase family protein [Agromyces mediolanus]|uniref:Phytoene synthase n=1 Tax=Agromyces mediolanus TaxID=41986 RepID=A0A918CJH2_AGRME|nr:phytoene/squalene synthase family protein [Agromyces mediolanus]GGR26176.1 phytoene synthase [Agromyces mediolanus]
MSTRTTQRTTQRTTAPPAPSTGLALYDRTAAEGSARVIRAYSTSFGLASRLCSPAVREHLAEVYALVRIADELVDGPAEEAGLPCERRRELLDALEADTEAAFESGYSANLVVHAFARAARRSGFGQELTRPFFASMRRDLEPIAFTEERELDEYVYGSAEVVGLMCLRGFAIGLAPDAERDARWERGARALGSAFQRVNFLRDLGEDASLRGRRYFPGVDPVSFSEAQQLRLLDGIDAELDEAAAVIPELPRGCRVAVAAAHGLFGELSARLRRTPAAELVTRRVRVPAPRKLAIVARVIARGGRP